MKKPFSLILKSIRDQAKSARFGEEVKERRRQLTALYLAIPTDKRAKVLRRMARILIRDSLSKNKSIDNYYLAKCLKPFLAHKPKLIRKKYKGSKKEYDKLVENRFRTLRKHWCPLGYNVRFSKNGSQLLKAL